MDRFLGGVRSTFNFCPTWFIKAAGTGITECFSRPNNKCHPVAWGGSNSLNLGVGRKAGVGGLLRITPQTRLRITGLWYHNSGEAVWVGLGVSVLCQFCLFISSRSHKVVQGNNESSLWPLVYEVPQGSSPIPFCFLAPTGN